MATAPYSNVRDAKFELREVKSAINPSQSLTIDDVQLLGFLRLATTRLTRVIGARFLPNLETKTFSGRADRVTGKPWKINQFKATLYLPEPLMALPTLVTDGDGNTLTYTTDYVEDPPGQTPITGLRLVGGGWPLVWGCKSWYASCNAGPGVASLTQVTGVWGFHADYANAYVDSLDTVQDNPLTSGAVLINVSEGGGIDELGRSPRFSSGQLIKLENELALINSVNGNQLFVSRHMNGTTAATHVKTTPITVFEPDDSIQQAARRWAAYPYKRRGSYENSTQNDLGTSITFPADMPGEVAGIVDDLIQEIYGGAAI